MIQIRHVLENVHRTLKSRAALEGLSLSDYLLRAVTRYSHESLVPTIWALRNNATAYDAAYLALTDTPGACLLTCDFALTTVPGNDRRVELIS